MLSLFQIDTRQRASVVELIDEDYAHHGVRVFIKREDLLHRQVSGNKYRKLKYNIETALQQGRKQLLSFGGAWSNHIHALAFAAQHCGLESIGIIRGESTAAENPTLRDARVWGMQLQFVDRATYRLRNDPHWLQILQQQYPDAMIIPEGGSNALALQGVAELWDDLEEHFDYVVTAAGSAGTAAGLISACPRQSRVVVVPVLKGEFMAASITGLLHDPERQAQHSLMLEGYHHGGYARIDDDLRNFIVRFEKQHAIPLDPVYTAKMAFAIDREIHKGRFLPGTRILLLHTGGLQGRQPDLL